MRRVHLVSFGPFQGRDLNGSRVVGERLAAGIEWIQHRSIAVHWEDLRVCVQTIRQDDHAIGLGEGWDWHAALERYAFRRCTQPDEAQSVPQSSYLRGPEVLHSRMRLPVLNERRRLTLQVPNSAGLVESVFGGHGLCNALHYLLLLQNAGERGKQLKRSPVRGFLHLPPMQTWCARTGQGAERYAEVFSRLVLDCINAQFPSR